MSASRDLPHKEVLGSMRTFVWIYSHSLISQCLKSECLIATFTETLLLKTASTILNMLRLADIQCAVLTTNIFPWQRHRHDGDQHNHAGDELFMPGSSSIISNSFSITSSHAPKKPALLPAALKPHSAPHIHKGVTLIYSFT
jgi:hypothetical protein